AVAQRFLTHGGYEVALGTPRENGEITVSGARGGGRCTITGQPGTSTEAIHELASNARAVVAPTQRPLTPSDPSMPRDAGAGDFSEDRELAEHVIGFDAFGVIVNASNPVHEIRYDYLREIVFGRVTNWKTLGGADAPFSLYAVKDGSGAEDYPN